MKLVLKIAFGIVLGVVLLVVLFYGLQLAVHTMEIKNEFAECDRRFSADEGRQYELCGAECDQRFSDQLANDEARQRNSCLEACGQQEQIEQDKSVRNIWADNTDWYAHGNACRAGCTLHFPDIGELKESCETNCRQRFPRGYDHVLCQGGVYARHGLDLSR